MPAQDTKPAVKIKSSLINPQKLLGDSGVASLGNFGGESKIGKLASIVRGNKKGIALNSRKISILKNIESYKHDPIGAKLPGGSGLTDSLNSIADTVGSIQTTLTQQQKLDEEELKDQAQQDEKAARAGKEKKLESKIFDGLKAQGEAVVAPIKSLWEKIWGFLTKLFLAKVVMNLFDWFADDKNVEKVKSMMRFVKDWWPAILGSVAVLVGGILMVGGGPIGAMIGAATMLVGVLTPIIAALGVFGGNDAKKLENQKKNLEKEVNAQGGGETPKVNQPTEETTGDTGDTPGADLQPTNANTETPDLEVGESNQETVGLAQQEQAEFPQPNLNQGGFVSGPEGVDKVPAKLTAGEFVMTKGAVEKFGEETLAGMNAAAGGTNTPMNGGYFGGGLVIKPNKKEKEMIDSGKFTEPIVRPGVIKSYEDAVKAGVEIKDDISPGMRSGSISWTEKLPKGLFGKQKYIRGGTKWIDSGFGEDFNKLLEMPTKDYVNKQMGWSSKAKAVAGPKPFKGIMSNFLGGAIPKKDGGPNISSSKAPSIVKPPPSKKGTGGGGGAGGVKASTLTPQQGAKSGKDSEVPQINAAAMRSAAKIAVLGISV